MNAVAVTGSRSATAPVSRRTRPAFRSIEPAANVRPGTGGCHGTLGQPHRGHEDAAYGPIPEFRIAAPSIPIAITDNQSKAPPPPLPPCDERAVTVMVAVATFDAAPRSSSTVYWNVSAPTKSPSGVNVTDWP